MVAKELNRPPSPPWGSATIEQLWDSFQAAIEHRNELLAEVERHRAMGDVAMGNLQIMRRALEDIQTGIGNPVGVAMQAIARLRVGP